jgi:hypothetical protein
LVNLAIRHAQVTYASSRAQLLFCIPTQYRSDERIAHGAQVF